MALGYGNCVARMKCISMILNAIFPKNFYCFFFFCIFYIFTFIISMCSNALEVV